MQAKGRTRIRTCTRSWSDGEVEPPSHFEIEISKEIVRVSRTLLQPWGRPLLHSLPVFSDSTELSVNMKLPVRCPSRSWASDVTSSASVVYITRSHSRLAHPSNAYMHVYDVMYARMHVCMHTYVHACVRACVRRKQTLCMEETG